MKLRATKKEIKEKAGPNLYSFGYCELDYLLKYEEPFAYSAGVYGWNCDYYNLDGVIMSTGYRPIGKLLEYKTVKKWNKKAKAAKNQTETRNLIKLFLKEIIDIDN
jgi:hypothetical protein